MKVRGKYGEGNKPINKTISAQGNVNLSLNLVSDIDDVVKPGDACTVTGKHKKTGKVITQLIICCPRCGTISASRGNHIYISNNKSYHPSIVHDVNYGGCGWHGWLKNGVFTEI